jgi:toxin ParE1/3/4
MSSKYLLADQAKRDLVEIWKYIAMDSINFANRQITLFHKSFSLLAQFPRLGKLQDTSEHPFLFYFPVGKYRITYEPNGKPLTIYRIVSSYRNNSSPGTC